jgi:hypothetical protein
VESVWEEANTEDVGFASRLGGRGGARRRRAAGVGVRAPDAGAPDTRARRPEPDRHDTDSIDDHDDAVGS